MRNIIDRIDGHLLQPALRAGDPDRLRRARLCAALALIMSATNAPYIALFLARRSFAEAAVIVAAAGTNALALASLRRGRVEAAAHLISGSLVTLVLGYVFRAGALHAGLTWPWSLLGVMMAFFLGGRAVGRVWAAVHCVAVGVAIAIAALGIPWPSRIPQNDGQLGLSLVALSATFIEMTLAYEAVKASMLREIADTAARARLVLDNVGDGFLLAGPDGALRGECSAAAARWFGPATAGRPVWDHLFEDDRDRAQMRLAWEELVADALPRELLIEQMPARLRRGDRTFALHYRVVGAEVTGVVVVARDITAALAAQAADDARAEQADLYEQVARDPQAFDAFLREAEALAEAVREGRGEARARALHTLKGNAAIFGARRLASWCHALEDRAADGDAPSDADLDELAARVASIRQRYGGILAASARRLDVEEDDVAELRAAVREGADARRLERIIDGWTEERVRGLLGRLAEQTRALARRLGREPVSVVVDAPLLRVPRGRLDALLAACAHLVRNAIDHGVEDADARAAAGKPPTASIRFGARREGGALVIAVADDGRGVDWERLRAKAFARGLPVSSRRDLVDALFADGVSTRDAVTEVSGRGVGMSAVREAVARLGGSVDVVSNPGQGTAVILALPEPAPSIVPAAA